MSHSTTQSETEREKSLMEIGDDLENIRDNLSDDVGMMLTKIDDMREVIQTRGGQDGEDMADLDAVIRECLDTFDLIEGDEDYGLSWNELWEARDRLLELKR